MRLLVPIIPNPAAPLAAREPGREAGRGARHHGRALRIPRRGHRRRHARRARRAAARVRAPRSPAPRVGCGWSASSPSRSGSSTCCSPPSRSARPSLSLDRLEIGAETLANGAGLALRLLAIVLAGVLATATSEPIEIADSLIQQLRVSPRFAIGVLAALRLLPLLAQEWQTLGLARRARGVEAGPIAARRRAPVRRQAPVAARRGHSARSADGTCHGGAWLRGASLPQRGAPAAHEGVRLGVDRRRAAARVGGHRDQPGTRHLAAADRLTVSAYHRPDAAHRRAAVPGREPGAGRNPHHS